VANVPELKLGLPGQMMRFYAVEMALVGVVAALLIRYVDRPLALRLSRVAAVMETDAPLQAVSHLGRGEYYLGIALAALLLGGWLIRRSRQTACGWRLLQAGALIAATLGTGHLLVLLLKQAFARLRPSAMLQDGGRYGFADPFSGEPFTSLPSSHAFTAFAMAAVFSGFRPELRAVFFGAALLVAVQRMLAHHHFLSDIYVSLFLALMVSEGMQAAWRRHAPVLARRLRP
jgi:undecaprenyl-diphosphatase